MSMFLKKFLVILPLVFSSLAIASQELPPLNEDEIRGLLKELDDSTTFAGDYKAIIYAHSKNRETGENIQQMAVYRRDADDRMMMLYLKPKSDAGKGYLLIDKNFFNYEPSTGGWTRVSDERIGGSALNRGNFNGFKFSERYDATFMGHDKLGKYPVYHLKLSAKDSTSEDEQVVDIWVHTKSRNVLKQQDFSLSGKLLRTTYRTDYKKADNGQGGYQSVPMKTVVIDEVEKGNQTTMVIEQIEIKPLVANIFTKAWLESKSR